MSMFHELMMRKKEQIMYATIKGTLTENDGVFSGFSSTSYLALQQSFTLTPTTKAEFVVKVNSSQMNEYSAFMGSYNSIGIVWRINAAEKLTLYVGNGSSWIISDLRGTTNILRNTDYYFRLKIDSGTFTTYLSTDGTNWHQEATTTITLTETYTYNLCLGIGRNTGTYFVGSIDLNKSYIKINSTKYKLQAVVGYTVVGSPTITDGVVSGFSNNDYIRTSQNLNILSTANRWEIQTAFSVSDLTNSPQMIMGNAYGTANGILFAIFKDTDNTYTLRLYAYNNGALFTALPTTKFNTLTKYYARIVFTGQQYKLLVSDDKINWNEIYSNNIDTNIGISNQYLFFGVDTRGNWSAFTGGQLYISETIIYQNNKLWFNGQQS